MAWTNIPNANLAAGAPIRSVDTIALRDNIPALAAGDSGAPKIVLKAFNDYYANDAVAGTTILYSGNNLSYAFSTSNQNFPSWQDSGFDYAFYEGTAIAWTPNFNNAGSTIIQMQYAFIALTGGSYRLTWVTDNGASGTTNESRIIVNGTQVYSVQHTGTTSTNRSYDVSVNPFDQVVLQFRRVSTSGSSQIWDFKVGTTGGGLIIRRV